ncbi:MAG: sterol desaturase family protein [Alphaproteobacteria bacterium]|nr:sterol desaturase family protein [Alphaproteobacteria bacterium]
MEDTLLAIGAHYLGAVGRSLGRYFVLCGGGFVVFWVLLPARLAHRKIQEGRPPRSAFIGELRDSVWSLLVMCVVSAISLYLWDLGLLKVYMDPMEHGLPWLIFTALLFVFGFDTYFYWAHRAMHHASLYSWTHEKHHEYTDPTPLASYSFTAWEALAYAVFTPPLLLLMPVNFWVLMISGAWFALASVYVHLGYELAPSWWGKSPLTRWIGTSTMHNMHHEYIHYNFALYFTFWDRAMGTMHPDYDETLEEMTSQPLLQRPATPGAAA